MCHVIHARVRIWARSLLATRQVSFALSHVTSHSHGLKGAVIHSDEVERWSRDFSHPPSQGQNPGRSGVASDFGIYKYEEVEK